MYLLRTPTHRIQAPPLPPLPSTSTVTYGTTAVFTSSHLLVHCLPPPRTSSFGSTVGAAAAAGGLAGTSAAAAATGPPGGAPSPSRVSLTPLRNSGVPVSASLRPGSAAAASVAAADAAALGAGGAAAAVRRSNGTAMAAAGGAQQDALRAAALAAAMRELGISDLPAPSGAGGGEGRGLAAAGGGCLGAGRTPSGGGGASGGKGGQDDGEAGLGMGTRGWWVARGQRVVVRDGMAGRNVTVQGGVSGCRYRRKAGVRCAGNRGVGRVVRHGGCVVWGCGEGLAARQTVERAVAGTVHRKRRDGATR